MTRMAPATAARPRTTLCHLLRMFSTNMLVCAQTTVVMQDVVEEDEQDYDRGDYADETTWEDLKAAIVSVQLTRNQLEEWVDQPFFDETVVGCFVRINIGTGKTTGEASYRVCEVVGIKNEESSVAYKLLNGAYTRRKLIVGLGSARKSWPIIQISNSPVQPAELDGWKKWCDKVHHSHSLNPNPRTVLTLPFSLLHRLMEST
jgi:hypothetical protein